MNVKLVITLVGLYSIKSMEKKLIIFAFLTIAAWTLTTSSASYDPRIGGTLSQTNNQALGALVSGDTITLDMTFTKTLAG